MEIWDKPYYEIFRLTANKLRELWEKDLEHNEDLQKNPSGLERRIGSDIQ